ncbi:MAG TPA: hypothetical protein VLA19_27400 [Herpetosiphonaceae bacterium]|nr:hypothetical protein [Herpetosiphonaceae bacterium]
MQRICAQTDEAAGALLLPNNKPEPLYMSDEGLRGQTSRCTRKASGVSKGNVLKISASGIDQDESPIDRGRRTMDELPDRTIMIRRLVDAARLDPRIVGLVDYGSSSEGRGDAWSDVDVALFLRDADFTAFEQDWKTWAAQFGTLLLAYVGGVGHPWCVYDGRPLPLRVDFNFIPVASVERMQAWPNAPVSVEAMVLYDDMGGTITAQAQRLLGKRLEPADLARTFERVCGDFWYYLLRTDVKLRRGQSWAARYDFTCIVVGNLVALLRIEAGAVARWTATSAVVGIERDVSSTRLAQLDRCIPAAAAADLPRAFAAAADLCRDVCGTIARQHSWPWPVELADRCFTLVGGQ